MRFDPSRRLVISVAAAFTASSLTPGPAMALPFFGSKPRAAFDDIPYATWSDDEPGYRLYPGDQINVATPTAPELSRDLTVGPDGRISMPLVGPVMAADRSLGELEDDLSRLYARELRRPVVEVTLKQAAPMKVLVGGEVGTPGWVDMPGDLDALQAILAAGGFKTSAKRTEVVVIRRGPGGRPMRRVTNLSAALKDPTRADLVPLRRFDIIYVPRTSAAEAGVFMGQVRDLLPFSFSYSLNNPYSK